MKLTGEWNHNSYLLQPTSEQLDGAPLVATNAIKWAKGKLIIDNETANEGRLVFQLGVELVVSFSLNAHDGQNVFQARGIGKSGPMQGVEYHLNGWAKVSDEGFVTEVAGGILFDKGADANPSVGSGGQPPGTVGYFRLSK